MSRSSTPLRLASASLFACTSVMPSLAMAQTAPAPTATPIEHVIIIIGENATFDHVFATYVPPAGQSVENLLSRGIITASGQPGPHFAAARQFEAQDLTTYELTPGDKTPYATLPPMMTEGAAPEPSDTAGPPLKTLALAEMVDKGLPADVLPSVLQGATHEPMMSVDMRYRHGQGSANGPYPITPYIAYDQYIGSPTHRFYQMWQQLDCSAAHATTANPSGCRMDLVPWVETATGPGSNGKPRPAAFTDLTTGEGANAMGFYNVHQGDAPYLTELARTYTLSDNFHQAVLGGTGANHIMLGTGDMIFYTDAQGNAATPPANQIENPNPQKGTNDYFTQDGYAGGSYTACADATQPGVGPVLHYLASLPSHPKSRCEPGHYYLVNNYNPGYIGNGKVDTSIPFIVPPSHVRSIADALNAHGVSWRYYGEGFDLYLKDPTNPLYCNICNPFQYTAGTMANTPARQDHLKDLPDFYANVANGTLPAVTFIKPSALNDGHPASSKLNLFEGFTRKIITAVQANPALWAHTAIIITFDEGGGYYDSGYIQPVDFFGDGPRIPTLIVSPYSRGGRVVHTYYDHVSLLKFIEMNWKLGPITARSRDNLPNPVPQKGNPYVPANSPAIGDLREMFQF